MAGRFVAVVGAVAILLSACGLALDAVRPGPLDLVLEPATVAVAATGSYEAVAAPPAPAPLGLCAVEPCAARTRVQLELRGLPAMAYTARLEGDGAGVDLGPLARRGDAHVLDVDRAEDHTGQDRLVLLLAGLALHAWDVGPGARDLAGTVEAGLRQGADRLHLDEIGAVTVSTVSKADVPFVAPPGLELAAVRDGRELGTFEAAGGGSVLDGRVERLRIGAGGEVVVLLRDPRAPDAGFPVWRAPY